MITKLLVWLQACLEDYRASDRLLVDQMKDLWQAEVIRPPKVVPPPSKAKRWRVVTRRRAA